MPNTELIGTLNLTQGRAWIWTTTKGVSARWRYSVAIVCNSMNWQAAVDAHKPLVPHSNSPIGPSYDLWANAIMWAHDSRCTWFWTMYTSCCESQSQQDSQLSRFARLAVHLFSSAVEQHHQIWQQFGSALEFDCHLWRSNSARISHSWNRRRQCRLCGGVFRSGPKWYLDSSTRFSSISILQFAAHCDWLPGKWTWS